MIRALLAIVSEVMRPDPTDTLLLWGWLPIALVVIAGVMSRG